MKVGDTIKWTLPEEPPKGTVVTPEPEWNGVKWRRTDWSRTRKWEAFIEGSETDHCVSGWHWLMHTLSDRAVIESGPPGVIAGTELVAVLPPEPGPGSVVRFGRALVFGSFERNDSGGWIWRQLAEDGGPLPWGRTPREYVWRDLLYAYRSKVTIVRLGDDS